MQPPVARGVSTRAMDVLGWKFRDATWKAHRCLRGHACVRVAMTGYIPRKARAGNQSIGQGPWALSRIGCPAVIGARQLGSDPM